ncbi:MAG TPA: hypothetical protein VGG57_01255 [Stellaceae bacterium]|jgi:hypothetical protein
MTRPRAADDFAAIRARLKELRGEQQPSDALAGRAEEVDARNAGRGLGRIDERYRDRAEGAPPPWVPTIF